MNTALTINYIAFITIVKKEIVRFIRIWPQTLLPPAINTLLYFVIFGNLLGAKIGQIENIAYIQYLAPGFASMVMITSAYNNVASSFFSERFTRNCNELIWSPTSKHVMICGYLMGGILRSFLSGTIVLIIALFFTKIQIYHLWHLLAIALITATLFSTAGFINALFGNKFDSITTIPTFVLTPLIYLGGIFYSVAMLPTTWQKVSLFNPILYIVNSFRYSMLNISDVSVHISLLVCSVMAIGLYSVCYYLVARGQGLTE
jgi:ABC-2 type transport system permease protein